MTNEAYWRLQWALAVPKEQAERALLDIQEEYREQNSSSNS
jgi:hypothetical protein